jgi:catechol 2,3-dioxygenase-like lactoylglutathione lyase family enzyme
MAFVESVPRSVEFYRKLGFEVGHSHTPLGEKEPTWAWLASGGAHLMVSRASEPVIPSQQAVFFHVYCDDVHGFHEELREANVAVSPIHYPFYNPRGEFRLTDPDGYVLMVAHT